MVFIRWCGKLAARADDRGVIKEVMAVIRVSKRERATLEAHQASISTSFTLKAWGYAASKVRALIL